MRLGSLIQRFARDHKEGNGENRREEGYFEDFHLGYSFEEVLVIPQVCSINAFKDHVVAGLHLDPAHERSVHDVRDDGGIFQVYDA